MDISSRSETGFHPDRDRDHDRDHDHDHDHEDEDEDPGLDDESYRWG